MIKNFNNSSWVVECCYKREEKNMRLLPAQDAGSREVYFFKIGECKDIECYWKWINQKGKLHMIQGEMGELLELCSKGGKSGLVLTEVEVLALIRCKYNRTYFS